MTLHAQSPTSIGFHYVIVKNGQVFTGGDIENKQQDILNELNPIAKTTMPPVIAVSAGRLFTLALTNAGQVWGWGDNSDQQLGFDKRDSSLLSVVINFLSGSDTTIFLSPRHVSNLTEPIKEIATGWYHSLALSYTGQVFATGAEHFTLIPFPQRIKRIYACGHQNFAVDESENLYAWGSNYYGELGIGDISTTVIAIPQRVSLSQNMAPIKTIVGGRHYTAMLTENGNVYTCGSNEQGRLGRNANTPSVFTQVTELKDIVSLQAGQYHLLAREKTGQVWAWGQNVFHPIIDDSERVIFRPRILHPSAVYIACGGHKSFILTGDVNHYQMKELGLNWGNKTENNLAGMEDIMITQLETDLNHARHQRAVGVKRPHTFFDIDVITVDSAAVYNPDESLAFKN